MHEPTQLLDLGRFPRKGGRHGTRRWNVWYKHLECPACGRKFVRLQNPLKGRKVRCVGSDQLQVTKKED